MIVLTFGVLLIVLNILTSRKYNPLISMMIILLIMGFQDNCQNDFLSYQEDYRLAMKYGYLQDYSEHDSEPLWKFLMINSSKIIPWWMFVFFLACFECVVLYKFLKKFCKGKFAWIATILYYFTWNMMGMHMSLMRQGFVVAVMLAAFLSYEKTKKWKWPVIISVIAYLMHNSSVVMIPLLMGYIFLDKRKTKNPELAKKKKQIDFFPLIVTGGYLLLYLIKQVFLKSYLPALALMFGDANRLSGYLDATGQNHGMAHVDDLEVSMLIILYDAIIVFIVSYFYKYADLRMKWMYLLTIAAAFGDMMLFGIGSLPRIILYYCVFNIIVYPDIAQKIRSKWGIIPALAFVALLIGYAVKTSLPWMTGDDWGGIGTYQFVFF